ncbi:DnaJ C-terminal domain-containing protein [Castellaniella sp.]|uniref:DnaJ C-terminal domain-containing protein n=1 Tax=Castellaniella sp. TaxID=1955812 RepID=UPI00356078F2
MQYPDYYKVLGVSKTASAEDIKKAFRRLARKYHPDVSKEADAAQRMAEINEANEVLSDSEKRSVYDAIGHQAWAQGARSMDDVRPPPGWNQAQGRHPGAGFDGYTAGPGQTGAEYSEFFEELFGRAAREKARQNARGGSASGAWPGEDQHAEITLSLEEAYRGCERALQLQSVKLDEQGQIRPQVRTLNVKIPAGVSQGQLIRLAGQGGPGLGGGTPGDLFLKVSIQTDESARVDGSDVIMKVFVAPWEAALGGEIHVKTIAGTLSVTVPAGSVAGRKLRLRGKGIPAKKAGDLYLELDIAVPSAITPEQRQAWQALANAYPGYEVRPR